MFKEEVGAPAPPPGMVYRLRQALLRAERRNERNLEIVTQTLGAEAELQHDVALLNEALDAILELAGGKEVKPGLGPWWWAEVHGIVRNARAKRLT